MQLIKLNETYELPKQIKTISKVKKTLTRAKFAANPFQPDTFLENTKKITLFVSFFYNKTDLFYVYSLLILKHFSCLVLFGWIFFLISN